MSAATQAVIDDRAGLDEQLGSALSDGVESMDMVAGLGAAALHVHHGADRRREPIAVVLSDPAHQADPQDALAAELGSLLRHIRHARQYDMLPAAVHAFAHWMAHRGRFAQVADAGALLPRLAARALHEWLSDRCVRCGGTGRLEQTAGGQLVRGTGRMARNAIFRACTTGDGGCGGSGKPMPSHTQRRIALGLELKRYEAEGWGANVRAAIAWLDKLQGRMARPLTIQLERRKRRD